MMKWTTAAAVFALSGCLTTELPPDSTRVAPPAGVTLPAAARVMVHVSSSDLNRVLTIERTRYRDQETDLKDGAVMAKASDAVLRQVFATVATNDPAAGAQLVARPMAKAKFSHVTGLLKIGCGIDLHLADGRVLASVVARQDFEHPVDFREAVPPGYTACLKKAADELVRSPGFAQIASGRLPAGDPAGRVAFLRSLGY